MSDVNHTDPHTRRPFGEHVVFARGPTVATDGGEPQSETETKAEANTAEDADDETADRMADVDHEPPSETEANPVFERGREGRDGAR